MFCWAIPSTKLMLSPFWFALSGIQAGHSRALARPKPPNFCQRCMARGFGVWDLGWFPRPLSPEEKTTARLCSPFCSVDTLYTFFLGGSPFLRVVAQKVHICSGLLKKYMLQPFETCCFFNTGNKGKPPGNKLQCKDPFNKDILRKGTHQYIYIYIYFGWPLAK